MLILIEFHMVVVQRFKCKFCGYIITSATFTRYAESMIWMHILWLSPDWFLAQPVSYLTYREVSVLLWHWYLSCPSCLSSRFSTVICVCYFEGRCFHACWQMKRCQKNEGITEIFSTGSRWFLMFSNKIYFCLKEW